MYFIVFHRDITDWNRFQSLDQEVQKAPGGLKSLAYFPTVDHRSVFWLWHGDSEATVRNYLDGLCKGLCTNEYFTVDASIAKGLPKVPVAV